MKKRTILVDMDATICEYDGWKGVTHFGDPLPGAKEFLIKLQTAFEIGIWTTRCNAESNGKEVPEGEIPEVYLENLVKSYLNEHSLPFDRIFHGKPLCVGVIDDRAHRCRPQEDPQAYERVLEELGIN